MTEGALNTHATHVMDWPIGIKELACWWNRKIVEDEILYVN